MRIASVCAVLFASTLSACGGIDLLPAEPEDVEVVEVFRSTQCGTQEDAPQLRWLPDRAAVEALSLAVPTSALSGAGAYVLVEMGMQSSGGYQLAVSRKASREGDRLTLYATFLSPPEGAMVTMALTSPCVLVSLPPLAIRRVELVDQSGAVRAGVES